MKNVVSLLHSEQRLKRKLVKKRIRKFFFCIVSPAFSKETAVSKQCLPQRCADSRRLAFAIAKVMIVTPKIRGRRSRLLALPKVMKKKQKKAILTKEVFFHLAVKNRSAFFLHCFSSVSRGNCCVETMFAAKMCG